VNAFLAAALSHVMRTAGPIPSVAAVSVLHSTVVDGFVACEALLDIWGASQLRTGCLLILIFLTPLAEVTPSYDTGV